MVSNLPQLIQYALLKYPLETECHSMVSAVFDLARENDKRPAYVKVGCPDAWVKNINGSDKLRDVYIMVKIDRMVLDRANSLVVTPQEASQSA